MNMSGPNPVQSLFCSLRYFLNFVLRLYLTNSIKIDGDKNKRIVIYVSAIFVLKNARNLRLPCFTQIKIIFFANFL